MTLRANITTTYRDASASPLPALKNVQKEAGDQGVLESEGTDRPVKPATKALDQGVAPLTEQWGNRSAMRNDVQTPATVDAFERSSPKDKSILAQGAESEKPASGWRLDTNEHKVASGSTLTKHVLSSEESATKGTGKKSPAIKNVSANSADGRLDEHSGSMVRKVVPLEFPKISTGQTIVSSGKPEAPKSPSQSLPMATAPKIRLAEPSAQAPTDSAVANPSVVDTALAGASDEDAMQHALTAALQFGQVKESNSQTDSASSSDVAKHLQSEGVFGISANGRNLGTVDFIRQKQFEYTMDQKPFTTDDLLLEAEKAIHGTLNSDQSSAVSKSLLRAAESINAYRNQSVKSLEHAEAVAKPSRPAAHTARKTLKQS